MRRNRRNNAKKERIIMIASSAFVLTALTMTGIYMKSDNTQSQDDGYTLDIAEVEDNAPDKFQEIAENDQIEDGPLVGENSIPNAGVTEMENMEDDLDYMPLEVGSGTIEIPGLTSGWSQTPVRPDLGTGAVDGIANNDSSGIITGNLGAVANQGAGGTNTDGESDEAAEANTGAEGTLPADTQTEDEETAAHTVVTRTLNYSEIDGLVRPVSGEVLMPFSMDSSIYFATLDQYKYNPALMLSAEVGTSVLACAEGLVVDIFENAEIGKAVTMDLGNGYLLTYGQLADINVELNSYVNPGEAFATVASPTKYYSVEGSNLYLKLVAEGIAVNPEMLFH